MHIVGLGFLITLLLTGTATESEIRSSYYYYKLDDSKADLKYDDFGLIISTDEANKNNAFSYYDISYKGELLLSKGNKVRVYDDSQTMIYSITVKTSGTCAALWKDENILIFRSRPNDAIEINREGVPVAAYQFDENASFWDDIIDSRIRNVNDRKYYAIRDKNYETVSNNVKFGDYYYIVIVMPDGSYKTIFSAKKNNMVLQVVTAFVIIFVLGLCALRKIYASSCKNL